MIAPLDTNASMINDITIGGAVGAYVGPAPRASEVFDESGMWLDPSAARRLNALADLGRISFRDFLRSAFGALLSNWSGERP